VRVDLPKLPTVGEDFDRYRVLTPAASGGMASVYAVRRESIGGFGKHLALKVMHPHLSNDAGARDMFLDEGRIAARIEHPNVVAVLDVGDCEGLPFIVMEYLRGRSLARVVDHLARRDEELPLGVAVAVLARAAEGLHAAHEVRGEDGELLAVVHRDVSPQNIMLTYAGDVKVVDFGIAAARGRIASTRSGEIKGKLSYVSPEQLTKFSPVDRRSDVWALGVVAWELFAGRRLFRDEDDASTMWNVLNRRIVPLDELRSELPSTLCDTVSDCLRRDLDERLESCSLIASRLAALSEELGGGHRRDLAVCMDGWFASERALEEQRLSVGARSDDLDDGPEVATPAAESATTTVESGQIVQDGVTDAETDDTTASATRPAARPHWNMASTGLLALAVAGVAALAVGGDKDPSRSIGEASTSASASPSTTLSLPVGSGVRLVLVDGKRHDERPVRVTVGSEGTSVDLVAVDGRVERKRLTVADDGARLVIPPASIPAASAAPTAAAVPTASTPTGPPVARPSAPDEPFDDPYQ
jgi:eukaryotic-like serine/threonine-protein kinase